MKTQEQVSVGDEVPIELWRDAISREAFWEQMRREAAQVAAADRMVLTDTPGTRHVLYQRLVDDPEYLFRRTAECTEEQAEFVRLRLTCWAEAK
jgi:hypothetical protein